MSDDHLLFPLVLDQEVIDVNSRAQSGDDGLERFSLHYDRGCRH